MAFDRMLLCGSDYAKVLQNGKFDRVENVLMCESARKRRRFACCALERLSDQTEHFTSHTYRYDKMIQNSKPDSPPVQEMARRIADDGPQIFANSEDFCNKYSSQAYAMIVNGALISALLKHGICVTPAQYAGEDSDIPVGIKLVRRSR